MNEALPPHMIAPKQFQLEQLELDTLLCKRLAAHVEDRLAATRRKNDFTSNTTEQTQALRGQIAEQKYLLSLLKPERAQGTAD